MKGKLNSLQDVWQWVDKKGPEDCWEWLGWKQPDGYGSFSIAGEAYPAHRVVYEVTYGFTNSLVLHRCNNRGCCNPQHLIKGTHSDNSQHAVRSGRWGIGVRWDKSRRRWLASARVKGVRINLYAGKDFFEACCARKSWEAANPLREGILL